MTKQCLPTIALTALTLASSLTLQADEAAQKALFEEVTKRLDPGGRVFGYINVKDELRSLISEADEGLAKISDLSDGEIPYPEGLELEPLLLEMGLHQAEAFGFSSVPVEEGYRNRGYLAIDGERTGLLKLSGGDPKPFAVSTFAPQEAFLAFESEWALAALPELVKALDKHLEKATGEPATLMKFLRQPIPNTPYTAETLLTKLAGRVSGFFVPREQRLALPADLGIEMPALDGIITHQDGTWLFEQLNPILASLPEEMVTRTAEAGFEEVEIELPPQASLGFYRPVLHWDKDSGALHVATRRLILEAALAESNKLQDRPDFQRVMEGLGKEGSFMTYVSKEAYHLFGNVYRVAIKQDVDGDIPEDVLDWLVDWMGIDAGQSTASVLVNEAEGIVYTSKSPSSISTTMVVFATITPIAVIATVATPMIQKARATARAIPEIKRIQSLLIGLILYSGDTGGLFPDKLEDLFPDYLDDRSLLQTATGEKFQYIPGLTDNDKGSSIILFVPAEGLPDKVLVGFLDGSATSMDKRAFDTMLEKQKRDREEP